MHGRISVILNDNRGFIHYSYLILISGIIILLTVMLLENNVTKLVKDELDNNLTAAVISGIVYDYDKMYEMIVTNNQYNVDINKKHPDINVMCNINSSESSVKIKNNIIEAFNNNANIKNIIKNVKVIKVVVYNLSKNLEINTYANENSTVELYENYQVNSIKTPNGVGIKTSSVYVQIEFDIKLFGNIAKRVGLSKCIEVYPAK